jgi:predicted ATPase/DNA-binding SARP family transcriptional activator
MSKSAPQSPRWTSAAWSVLPVLIGRDQDIATLEQTVQQRRLVTLWGPGGSGKTCLAQHVAQHLQNTFADGVRFVACADLHDPELLVLHMATSLGVQVPDAHRPIDTLIEWLQARHLLLVVDNCEHLLTACTSLVDELMAACCHLHVLLTSRELLNLPTEHAYPVQPLTLPPPSRCPGEKNGHGVTRVETYSAIQLFIQRAQVAQPDFALTSENAALIVRICRLVDGLPLAIELAAARVRMLALEQLADRLESSPGILSSANRLAPARQQTLQATISWSYQLLAPAEQQLFRRLALVAGSFDLSLVEALQEDAADLRRDDVVDLLAHLIDKSLVTVVGLDGTARYRMLDTLQHYGREQLQQSGETDVTCRRYQEWVCHLVEDAEAELAGPRQGAWLDRLEAEIEHIRAVIRWLLQCAEVAPVVQISSALVTFCGYRAHTHEVIQWLEKALAKAGAIEPALETKAFFALGVLSIRRHRADPKGGHLIQAQDYLTKAQEGHARVENQAGMAGALCQVGYVYFWQADYPAARTCLEAGLAIVPGEALNLRADLLHRLAITVFQLGALQEAVSYYRQSLALRRQTEDVGGLAVTLACLGGLLCELGDHAQAEEYLRESLGYFQDLGDHDGYLLALDNLYDVALALKDPMLTQDYLAFALSSVWADGDIRLLAGLFEQMARMALLRGRPVQAARLFGITASLCGKPLDQMPDAVRLQLQQAPRASAGLAQYAAAWRDGRQMGLDEAFAFAFHDASAADNEPHTPAQANATPGIAVKTSRSGAVVNNHATVTAIAPLRIEAFGGGTVYREQDTTEVIWHYSSARELLFYLLDAPHRTKEQICLALWPDTAMEQAGTHMRVTFYQLRKTLADAAWVPFTPAGYAFNRSLPYRYDVEQFQDLIAQADALRETHGAVNAGEADDDAELLAQACALYRGTYLADFPPHEWIVQRQTELQRQYLHALSRLGAAYERQGDNQQALAWYQRLTACDPYDEQAHAAILRCYVRLGRRSKALRYYRDLQHFLLDELGVTPDPHITAFVRGLLSQMGAAS